MSLLSSAKAWLSSLTAGAPMPAPMPPTLATIPSFSSRSVTILRDFFVSHDIPAETTGAWVTFPGQPYQAQMEIVSTSTAPDRVQVQLDLRFAMTTGHVLVESLVGVGADRDEAIGNAVKSLTECSLHVVQRAFFGKAEDQVTQEEWEINGLPRQLTVGNVIMRSSAPVTNSTDLWFPRLEHTIRAAPLPAGDHWVRMYYAQHLGKALEHEALLDNNSWPALKEAMRQWPWPQSADFYSVRLFLIIRDLPLAPAPIRPD